MLLEIFQRFLERKKEPKTLRSQLVAAGDSTIDLLLDDGSRVLVPREDIPKSQYLQSYALRGTRVVDIQQDAKDKDAFYVFLDTGIHYTIIHP